MVIKIFLNPGFSIWGEKPSYLTFLHQIVPQIINNI